MMICPGCSAEMVEEKLEAKYGGALVVDLCLECHALWFDGRESLQLSPGSVLRLFRIIHERAGHTPRPKQERLPCPRCDVALVVTHDLIRGTRFSYDRCPEGHGRHTTFFQFLREKNLVRDLDARQLAELKVQFKVIKCSSCGAPVDLQRTSLCDHCRAPISVLDPEQVRSTLETLKQADAKRSQTDPTLAMRLLMDQMQAQKFYRNLEAEFPVGRSGLRRGPDLIDVGIGIVLGALWS